MSVVSPSRVFAAVDTRSHESLPLVASVRSEKGMAPPESPRRAVRAEQAQLVGVQTTLMNKYKRERAEERKANQAVLLQQLADNRRATWGD